MQNNFECIFKLIVAFTFLMRVVCSHYQYSFFMFYTRDIPEDHNTLRERDIRFNRK